MRFQPVQEFQQSGTPKWRRYKRQPLLLHEDVRHQSGFPKINKMNQITHAARGSGRRFKKTMNATNRKLKTSSTWSGNSFCLHSNSRWFWFAWRGLHSSRIHFCWSRRWRIWFRRWNVVVVFQKWFNRIHFSVFQVYSWAGKSECPYLAPICRSWEVEHDKHHFSLFNLS